MKALLKNYPQAPRKVRLVADLIRGKSITDARAALTFLPKKSSPVLLKLINSAVANAGANPETLYIKAITVNKGAVLRRYRPFARGRAGRVGKEMSIVRVELGTKETGAKGVEKKTKKAAPKKAAKKTAKKTTTKSE